LQPDREIKIEFSGVRPGEKLLEELNLEDEDLVLTSHAKIRSYVSPYEVDPKQIKACMQNLQKAVSGRDVLRLVLLLKELIPDYNPDSKLLLAAIPVQSNHAEPAVQVPSGPAESVRSANFASATRVN
jgi:FlaA1/EpsC-like NDP-sugar epimerase